MLGVGQKLPEFKIIGVKPGFNSHEENGVSAFEPITKDSFEGKWKVIFFYPKDFTFVCPTELAEFNKQLKAFAEETLPKLENHLQMAKAMGLNTVCAYLFWNMHEPRPGEFNWSGQADAAEFCRIAQEEGAEWYSVGTEMESSQRFKDQWIHLIQSVREVFKGKITAVCSSKINSKIL